MLHPNPFFRSWSGIGDMLMCLPLMENLPSSILYGPHWNKNRGLERLFRELAPTIELRFELTSAPWGTPFAFDSTFVEYIARRLRVEPRYRASRTLAVPRGDYLVAHPYTISEKRSWDGWKDLELDLPVVVIGGGNDPRVMDGEWFDGDFYETARLIAGSRGLVCINSFALHVANLLGVKCLCIHRIGMMRHCFPSMGVNLINPTPRIVKEQVWNYLWAN